MKLQELLRAHKTNCLDAMIKRKSMMAIENCWHDLIQCKYKRKFDLVKTLIEKGIDCDLRNYEMLTPIEYALVLKDHKLVKLMLDTEANRFPQTQRMVYRLIRRGNVELLKMYFESKQTSERDQFSLVSYALEEMLVKKVSPMEEMEAYCIKIQLLMCYSTTDTTVPDKNQRIINIRERLGIMLREITFLLNYDVDNSPVDAEFLLALDIISDNMYIISALWSKEGLRRLGPRSMWDQLHTKEIIYYIYIFTRVQNRVLQVIPVTSVLLVDSQFMFAILRMLRVELTAIKTDKERRRLEGLTLEEDLLKLVRQIDIYAVWKRKYPDKKISPAIVKLKRRGKALSLQATGLNAKQLSYLEYLLSSQRSLEQIQTEWSKLHPSVRLSRKAVLWALETIRFRQGTERSKPFSERMPLKSRRMIKLLIRRYQSLKTLLSLEKLIAVTDIMAEIPLTHDYVRCVGFAAFKGALHWIGEYSKCTDETANLNERLHKEVTCWNSQKMNRLYEQERNIFSHGLSLSEINFRKRCDQEDLSNVRLEYCRTVQKDIGKRSHHFRSVYELALMKALRSCCSRIMCFKSIEQCRVYYGLARQLLPEAYKGVNPCFRFKEMHALLEQLKSHKNSANIQSQLHAVLRHVQLAQEEDHAHRTAILLYENCLIFAIQSLAVAKNLESARRLFSHYITMHSITYYSSVCFTQLREANVKLSQLVGLPISPDIKNILFELNLLLAGKENRQNDLNKYKFYQFVPYEDELYTENLLAALNIHLDAKKFYYIHNELNRKIYNPVYYSNEANIFNVEKKLKVLQQVLTEQSIPFQTSALVGLHQTETRKFQLIFEETIQALYDLVDAKPYQDEKLEATRRLAIKMGLLDICEILSHTKAFQMRLEYLNSPAPPPVGRIMRNILAHDVTVAGSSVLCSENTINLTVQVLYELRHEILNCERKHAALPLFGPFAQKYKRRKRLLREQKIPIVKTLDNFLMQCDPQFDIYGLFTYSWSGSREAVHGLLDVLLHRHADDAIAFVEDYLHSDFHVCESEQLLVLYYLWKRLPVSTLLGLFPERIIRAFSNNGFSTGIVYQSGIESVFDTKQFKDTCIGAGFEDDGFEPLYQIEKLLAFCMKTGRFIKFKKFFNCYGKRFDFFAKSNFSHPQLVEKLSDILPWNSTDSSGRNLLHLLCSANNVDAIRDALNNTAATKLMEEKSVSGHNPLQTAAISGCFEIIEIFLTNSKCPPVDDVTLKMVISCHRNNLLTYFTNQLKSGMGLSKIMLSIANSANVEAFHYLRNTVSPISFRRMLNEAGNQTFLYYLIFCGAAKAQTFSKFLTIPEVYQTIDEPGSKSLLYADMERGKFKNVRFLLELGATVNLAVIRRAALSNSYRYTKKLYRESNMILPDSELISLITAIILEHIDVRILKFFVQMLTTKKVPYQWLELSIQRHAYKYVQYLCETFPSMLQEFEQKFTTQPVNLALLVTERWDSFAKDKPVIKYLLERTSNLTHPYPILLEAVRICDLDIIRYLLNRRVPLDSVSREFTALAYAAFLHTTQRQRNSHAILKALLEQGSDVQFLLDNKPAYFSHIQLMEMVLQYTNFDPCKVHPKVSFFHNACATGSLRLVKLLVEQYKVNIGMNHGYMLGLALTENSTPLMVCVWKNSFEVIRYLLPRVNDLKIIEKSLIHAIMAGKVESVKLLLPCCPSYKTIPRLNAITVMAYDSKQLHVFIYLHSILVQTLETR
ncbi:uncharacterized protein LOC129731549 [Wyeomyia smithii]|uniref:uncharacterized protein LOC129731549 n=1 Tax=Wyeomyia smithii TaxID=174621 RepID=UPI002467FC86|nr:uncharacterized protein LOC129731549 [Wyeomyia smithii]XP_055547610.1 uncharacterized protein LOC129731549 [Wyeomyia smithii]XP_055547611.1 uncharacterized protein LOC129731549 [Wyeomyia smithii]XP_055547612.1 uncharacterized protein LOC129731549 [Wyeomyia smithii]